MRKQETEIETVAVDAGVRITENPYLSIVMASRNDDHGGNLRQRIQVSLDSLLAQLEKHRIESELIVVDWNPPPDKPPLRDTLKWPAWLKYCTVRNIVVPPSIHQRYKDSDKTPFGVGAMNCGIRRARGQFILPRAADVIYTDELVAYIATKSLKLDERYRVNRCDVDRNVVKCDTLQEQLDFCRENIIHVNAPAPPQKRRKFLSQSRLPELHTNASGDFQLMSRHYWHLLRGYREPEDDILSAYADSLLSFASYAADVFEVVLKDPLCIYHIDHDSKFTQWPNGSGLPFENWLSLPFLPARFNKGMLRLYRIFLTAIGYRFKGSMKGIPTLHYTEYQRIASSMVSGRRSYIFNDENWGLGQDSLEEHVIMRAVWDKDYERNY